jgi:hypothetical protein
MIRLKILSQISFQQNVILKNLHKDIFSFDKRVESLCNFYIEEGFTIGQYSKSMLRIFFFVLKFIDLESKSEALMQMIDVIHCYLFSLSQFDVQITSQEV